MRNVYIVGASGSGKTTLANYISKRFGLPVLPSAARETAKQFGVTEDQFEVLLEDSDKFAHYQKVVALRQLALEREAKGQFISCRAFDFIAFEALYGRSAGRTWAMPEVHNYFRQLRECYNVIFFIRPDPEILKAALRQGGRRPYLNWDDVMRFDGAMHFIFETQKIPYYRINNPNLNVRLSLAAEMMINHGFEEVKDEDVGTR